MLPLKAKEKDRLCEMAKLEVQATTMNQLTMLQADFSGEIGSTITIFCNVIGCEKTHYVTLG